LSRLLHRRLRSADELVLGPCTVGTAAEGRRTAFVVTPGARRPVVTFPAGTRPRRGNIKGDGAGGADRSTRKGAGGIGRADDRIGAAVVVGMHHVMGMLGRLRTRDRKQCRTCESRSDDGNFLGIHFLFSMGFFLPQTRALLLCLWACAKTLHHDSSFRERYLDNEVVSSS